MKRAILVGSVAALVTAFGSGVANAAGAWGGQDFYHVPVSWCAVAGSPAANNPNILPIGSATPDTTTDAVLWRRHERPTDFIYTNPAGITFRSAINNAWTVLNFPIIADPDTTLGQPGDMRGEDVNTFGVEFNQLINNCDAVYASPAYGRAGIGITAINANLFHDAAGDYVGTIGWGGCTESVATGNCVAPYDGRAVVIDNNYLYPTVADRTFPPSPADPAGNLQFVLTDPLDQLVGHEFGHALSLNHRAAAPPTPLMNAGQTDDDGDGNTDNIALNAAEVTALRTNALGVPGLAIDPPEELVLGNFVRTRIPDAVREHDQPPFLDLAAIKVTLNKQAERVQFGAQLFGVIPAVNRTSVQAWFLVDGDGPGNGLTGAQLKEIGAPDTRFPGADVVIRADATGTRVTGTAWRIEQGSVRPVRDIVFDLHRLVMEPHFSPLPGRAPPKIAGGPIHDIIVAELPAPVAGIALARPFQMQVVLLRQPGGAVADKIDETREERGIKVVVENPSFAACFVQEQGTPGDTVPVRITGLRANRGIHGLLGPREVFTGTADAAGGGMIDFPIPGDAEPGFHLVTIGTDGTALTADCVVEVVARAPRRPLGPREFSLLKSYEDLLKGQQKMIAQLGETVREVLVTRDISDQEALKLTNDYQQLVKQHGELVARFGRLVRDTAR